jgi:hypothetical protein
MTRSLSRTLILAVVISIGVVIGWALIYPSESDPKNIKYVLWKFGLYAMNLDTATGTMIGDRGREKLVIGKTKAQLRRKFGYVLTPSEAQPYMRSCYVESSWRDRDVVLIRNSPWMVVFEGERAAELVLCKG